MNLKTIGNWSIVIEGKTHLTLIFEGTETVFTYYYN